MDPELAHDNRSPVLEELRPGARRLYFLFGGINSRVGMPQFEFYRAARILDEHKIFLRDFSQSWYQRGLPGIAGDPLELGAYLKSRIEELGPEEVTFVGNSMGGFAAILFASMLGVGRAVAFAPQTSISPARRLGLRDFRWTRQLLSTYANTALRPHVYDLPSALGKQLQRPQAIEIYYSREEQLDAAHAELLAGREGVQLHPHHVGGPKRVRHLRDTGVLAGILRGSGSAELEVTGTQPVATG